MTAEAAPTAAERQAVLSSLDLGAFKSLVDQRLDLHPVTVLVGKNGSGKSNVIEALATLARLMSGDAIGEALAEGTEISDSIRGLAAGCVPHGLGELALGCRVTAGTVNYEYQLAIRADANDATVVGESLSGEGFRYGGHRWDRTVLFETLDGLNPAVVDARIFNGRRGRNPRFQFRPDRPVITQLRSTLPESKAHDTVLDAARAIVEGVRGIKVLDPVPQLMRGYARLGDGELRRSGDNISAALHALSEADPESFEQLRKLLASTSEVGADEITFEVTKFGDVMFAIRERVGPGESLEMPARILSDGVLRLAAIATSVLARRNTNGREVLVIEELENGLHPSLARDVLEFLRREAERRGIVIVATTHSATFMGALMPRDHEGVVLTSRDPLTGRTVLVPLVDAPGYVATTLSGSLAAMLEEGRIPQTATAAQETELSPIFDSVLGL